MRTTALALMSTVLFAFAAGCGEQAATDAQSKPPEPKRFAVIARWAKSTVEAGAEAAAEKLPGDITVTVVQKGAADEQVAELKRLASAGGVDGIAIDCVSSPEVTAAISEVRAAGIPVVTYNSDAPGADPTNLMTTGDVPEMARNSYVGCSLDEMGRMMGTALFQEMGGVRGTIAVIGAPADQFPNLKIVEDAARAVLDGVPDVNLLETVRPNVAPDEVASAMQQIRGQYQGIRAWLILNPAAAPDATAAPLGDATNSIVVMLGLTEGALAAVAPDKVDILVAPPMVEYGAAVIEMLTGITRKFNNYPDTYYIGAVVVDVNSAETIRDYFRKFADAKSAMMAHVPPAGAPRAPAEPRGRQQSAAGGMGDDGMDDGGMME